MSCASNLFHEVVFVGESLLLQVTIERLLAYLPLYIEAMHESVSYLRQKLALEIDFPSTNKESRH